VLLSNATTGLNVLLKSLVRRDTDVVFMPDIGYGSTKKIAEAVCSDVSARFVVGKVTLPLRRAPPTFSSTQPGPSVHSHIGY
jgi:hypothetical protein